MVFWTAAEFTDRTRLQQAFDGLGLVSPIDMRRQPKAPPSTRANRSVGTPS